MTPHQKFYYTYNFDRPFDFHVELIKILLDDTTGKVYPQVVRSVGDAPKPLGATIPSPAAATGDEEFDFLHEEGLNPEDAHDFAELGEEEEAEEDLIPAVAEEPEDEFDDEFADNEHLEDEDLRTKDDY